MATSVGEFEAALASMAAGRRAPAALAGPIERVAVLGAGPVGQALACALLAAGCEVRLHSAFASELDELAAADSITVRGESLIGTYRLSPGPARQPHLMVRQAIDAAIAGAEAILIATPAVAHPTYAGLLAPVLTGDRIVALVPGRGFGAVEFARCLHRFGCGAEVTIVEVCSSPYLVEATEPGRLQIHAEKRALPAAALPNRRTAAAIQALRPGLPMLRDSGGVLETTFCDLSGVLHVAPAILSAAAVEPGPVSLGQRLSGGLGPTVIRRLDAERLRVGFAFGVRDLMPAHEWLADAYELAVDDLDGALQTLGAYDRIASGGSPELDGATRDLVATSLVPLVSAGELAGVPTPAASALVDLASVLAGVDYMRHGRTLASLGLDRLSADLIRRALDGADASLLAEALA